MPEVTHQHSAIMFTDIVGYTTLMGEDEQRALELLKTNKELHQNLIAQFNGKLIKGIGDGFLASFNLASDAVYCAGALQKSASENNIELKIGIHEGEVVLQDNDVFGDGVNIASRILTLASKEDILVSESVYRDIKNKEGIHTEFLKEETFKNVDEPIKIYKVSIKNLEQNRISDTSNFY